MAADFISELDSLDLQRITWDIRKRLCIAACILLAIFAIALPVCLWGVITQDAALAIGLTFLGLSMLVSLPAAGVCAFMQTIRVRKLKALYREGMLSNLPSTPIAPGTRIGESYAVTESSPAAFAIERRAGKTGLIIENLAFIATGLAMTLGGIIMLASFGLTVHDSAGDISVKGTVTMYLLILAGLLAAAAVMLPRTYSVRIGASPASLVVSRLAFVAVDQSVELTRNDLAHIEIDQYNTVRIRTTAGRSIHLFSCGSSGGTRGVSDSPTTETKAGMALAQWRTRRTAAAINRLWAKARPIESKQVQATPFGLGR